MFFCKVRSYGLSLMKFTKQKILKLYLIKPDIYRDKRGSFRRGFCDKVFFDKKINFKCVQTNISENMRRGTLRGFHYHKSLKKEAKVISCIKGKIFLSILDLRKRSKTFMKKVNINLSAKNKYSVFIPNGCATAFLTLENNTVIYYLMGDYYEKKNDAGFNFKSKNLNIKWPIKPKIISKKDLMLPDLNIKDKKIN